MTWFYDLGFLNDLDWKTKVGFLLILMIFLAFLGTVFLTLLTVFLKNFLPFTNFERIEKDPRTEQSKFEFWQQIKSIFWSIFFGYGAVFLVILLGKSKIYYDFGKSFVDFIWLILTIPLMILMADLYIFTIHFILHFKNFGGVFWQIHKIHHKSIHTNVFSSYSLDVVESVLYTFFLAIFIYFVPTHFANFVLFMIITVIYNFYIHSGFEILPSNLNQKTPFKFLNTATLHQIHHRKHGYNFAFFTNIWDRIFGTFHN